MIEPAEAPEREQSTRRARLKGWIRHTTIPVWWATYQLWHHTRKRLGLLPPAADRRIVIGLGLHRTGTRSLSKYLASLGMTDVHWPWWCQPQVSQCLSDPEAVADILDPLFYRYDALTDVPFPGLYRVLDRRFPASRFILVRRDPDAWWSSVCRHWDLEQRPRRLDPLEVIQYAPYGLSADSVVSVEDRETHIGIFRRHVSEVRAYFVDRPDKLLVVDLEDDRIAARISAFLGEEVLPYPFVTRSRTSTRHEG